MNMFELSLIPDWKNATETKYSQGHGILYSVLAKSSFQSLSVSNALSARFKLQKFEVAYKLSFDYTLSRICS